MTVLCIDHLHEFELPVTAARIECPVCGCRYVRRATGRAHAVVEVLEGRHALVEPLTWLNDRKTFVQTARAQHPEMSDDELQAALARWEHDNG